MLSSWKQKALGPRDIKTLLQLMQKHQLKTVSIWKISTMTKFVAGISKLQAYLMVIAGLLFIPPTIYEKYQDKP